MHRPYPQLAVLSTLVFAATVCGQTVTSSISAALPFTVQATVGTQSVQNAQPAGPLPGNGLVQAAIGGGLPFLASGSVAWFRSDSGSASQVTLYNTLNVDTSVNGSAQVGANQMVVEFTAPSPVPVALELRRASMSSAGVPWPTVAVDLGNDGTIDLPNLGVIGPVVQWLTVGPQPLQVRVLFGAQAMTSGDSWTAVDLTVLPDNALTITRNSLGCGTALMFASPVFEGRGVSLGGDPGVFVIGFTTQPLLLQPAPFPGIVPWPCLLMPSPDITLFSLAGLQIPLPAAVRPITFHAQMVFVSPADGLWTTDGYTIQAQ